MRSYPLPLDNSYWPSSSLIYILPYDAVGEMDDTGRLDHSGMFQLKRAFPMFSPLCLHFEQTFQLLQIACDCLRILGKLLVGHVRSPI